MDVLKDKLNSSIDKWKAEIDSSPEKHTVVDMARIFEDLFCSNIVIICFGEDVSEMQIEIEDPSKNTREKLGLAEALRYYISAVFSIAGGKWYNPFY